MYDADMVEEIEMLFLQFWNNIFAFEFNLGFVRFSCFQIFLLSIFAAFLGLVIHGLFFDD